MTKYDMRKANINASAVGDNASVVNTELSLNEDERISQLKSRIADVRSQLIKSQNSTASREELGTLLDRLESAITEDSPDPEIVHSRWERVRMMLSPALQVAANVAQITSLVHEFVHG